MTATPQRQTNEIHRRLSGVKSSGHSGGHREPIEDEPGGVVDQALPLQQHGDARRQGEALQKGLGGDRIGWETIAPSAKHAAHGSDGATQWATTPTAKVVNATAPTAS